MMRKSLEAPRCANGSRCVAYPALGEPAKLSRSNHGRRCFACEERRVASELKRAAAKSTSIDRGNAKERPWLKTNQPTEHQKENAGGEHTELERAREVLERRKRSVLTCERGLRSALASSDERLVRRWSRSLRDAEDRLAWAEAELARAEKRVWSERAS